MRVGAERSFSHEVARDLCHRQVYLYLFVEICGEPIGADEREEKVTSTLSLVTENVELAHFSASIILVR